jgi:octaprenyl-diphosphate synthase
LSPSAQIRQIEKKLGKIIGEDLPILRKIKSYTIASGGKRIRPLAHYYFLRMMESDHKDWVDVASIGELIHNASLLHDDVVDESDLRRGKPSAPVLFGNKTVVLAGDYLLACGLHHLSNLEHSERLISIFSGVIRQLSEGELIQMEYEGSLEIPEKAYERVIHCKTACLFGAMTETAALLAGRAAAEQKKYRMFGERLGRYFQIRDDFIDYFQPAGKSGKKEMQDFERGLVTWPVILLRAKGRAVKQELARIWKSRSASQGSMLSLIQKYSIESEARSILRGELASMISFVNAHPQSSYRNTMVDTLRTLDV